MRPSDSGAAAAEYWAAIPAHFPNVELDAFVLMPNHLHGIIVITPVGAQHAAPLQSEAGHLNVKPGSLGAIVRSFKSATSKAVHALPDGQATQIWQRNYYEHVIRNERELQAIRRYIELNPIRWELDRDNLANQQPLASTIDLYLRDLSAGSIADQ